MEHFVIRTFIACLIATDLGFFTSQIKKPALKIVVSIMFCMYCAFQIALQFLVR